MSSPRGIGRPAFTPIEGTTSSAEKAPPRHPPRGAAVPYKSPLLVAVGVALGIAAASISPRPAAPPPPPDIGVRSGLVEADGSIRTLTPRSIRVGDEITRLAPREAGRPDMAVVYLDVNGERVILALAIEPEPVSPRSPSPGITSRPAVGKDAIGFAPQLDS